ncbi:MAG: preprotein translocase subunit SecG [Candidatus Omnitrophica bacterium]|nr:preprotein translocase subunit SecG [Candidatus Omnitrophota bacterium]
MYIVLIAIHIIVCFFLIATILLQAGRGGGLAEAFGGGENAQSVLGTQAPTVLKKATEISAIVFLITSLLLGVVASRMGRSLFDQRGLPSGTSAGQEAAFPQVPQAVKDAGEDVSEAATQDPATAVPSGEDLP